MTFGFHCYQLEKVAEHSSYSMRINLHTKKLPLQQSLLNTEPGAGFISSSCVNMYYFFPIQSCIASFLFRGQTRSFY